MIPPNATLTWLRKTSSDSHGQPVHTLQAGSYRVLAEAHARKILVGDRTVVSSMRIHIPRPMPLILPGDKVFVTSLAGLDGLSGATETLRVLSSETTSHRVLGHTTLLCG